MQSSATSPALIGTNVKINCLHLGKTSKTDVFPVTVGLRNTVADFKVLIVNAGGSSMNITDFNSLALWRVHKNGAPNVWNAGRYLSNSAFLKAVAVPMSTSLPVGQHFGAIAKPVDAVHVLVERMELTSSAPGSSGEASGPSQERASASASPPVAPDASPLCQEGYTPDERIPTRCYVGPESELSDDDVEPAPSALSSSIVLVTSQSEGTPDSSADDLSATFSSTVAAAVVSECTGLDVSSQTSQPSPSESAVPASSSETASPTAVPAPSAPSCAPSDVLSQTSLDMSPKPSPPESEQANTATTILPSTAAADLETTTPLNAFPPIPLALLHRTFGKFIDDLTDPCSSDRKSDFTTKLSDMLSSSTTAEQRLLGFTHLLREQLGINLKSAGDAGTMTATVNSHAYIMLQSLGSSAFLSDGDPFARCYKAYEEHVGRLSDDPSKLPVLPCLHIIICGPFMSFAGSAMACGSQSFEILLPAILFHPNPLYYGDAMKAQAARAFNALGNAAEALKRFYSDPSSRILNAPYPNIYRTRGNLLVTLTIEKRLELYSDDLVYRGLEDDVTPVVVGFTPRPREENEVLISMSDPGLRHAERLPGGWYMTVGDPWERLSEYGF